MKSYLNNPALKAERIAIMKAHQAADELVRGVTEGRRQDGTFRGCAVVCTIGDYDHAAYETELGIPRQLARIEDGIFESLPIERAMQWPLEFLEAVPVGVNLLIPYWQFMEWLLVDSADGVIRFAKTERTKQLIIRVAALYQSRLKGETPTYADAAADADADARNSTRLAARVRQADKLLELLRAAPQAV